VTAIEAYDQANADGTTVEAQSFYNLLNLCDGLADRGVHVGTPKSTSSGASADTDVVIRGDEIDLETRTRHAERIKERMDNLQIPLTESAFTALVKLFTKTNVDRAEEIIAEAETVQQCRPKLRMYSPLLTRYCETGRIVEALKVWKLISQQGICLTEREYSALLDCARLSENKQLADRVLFDLSEDVPVPSRRTSRAIKEWFQSNGANAVAENASGRDIQPLLQDISIPNASEKTPDQFIEVQRDRGWQITEPCEVDVETGKLLSGCLEGFCLKPVTISDSTWQNMKRLNEEIGELIRCFNGLFDSSWVLLSRTSFEWNYPRSQIRVSGGTERS